MRRAIVLFAAVLASCTATNSWAQNLVSYLPPGQVAPFGEDAYQVRRPPPPADDAETLAKQDATEYCKTLKKAMVVKTSIFSLGSGLYLIFSCVAPTK